MIPEFVRRLMARGYVMVESVAPFKLPCSICRVDRETVKAVNGVRFKLCSTCDRGK